MPPSAMMGTFWPAAVLAHSMIELIIGTPMPATTRVVQIDVNEVTARCGLFLKDDVFALPTVDDAAFVRIAIEVSGAGRVLVENASVDVLVRREAA